MEQADHHHLDHVRADDRAQDDDDLCAYEHDVSHYDDSRRFDDIDDTQAPGDYRRTNDEHKRDANELGRALVNGCPNYDGCIAQHNITSFADVDKHQLLYFCEHLHQDDSHPIVIDRVVVDGR